ncbi:sigma-54-dependent Fis family transcriptional regulator [Psychrosphaera sp. F3M07]|uniref:sigma-54 dependent transcriptional regulator n=1 Tax=Psychrosphaera sp. F3M07 TaxID=2841560 RepID=UPI001C0904DC|nr:sigma-54-dependent Fis family transcriptional regulator [Psychrosphaera sp. F3M07]MBU2917517.1 sigma-54-dependent Fis family transcriptional regulator [Psychrosphaera sp. F3M07]
MTQQIPAVHNILILDENERRANLMAGLLVFIGEQCEVVTESNFASKCIPEDVVTCCILGALSSGEHESIVKSQPAIPFLLLGDTLKYLFEQKNVLGILSEPFLYPVITQQIRDCQEYKRLMPKAPNANQGNKFEGLIGSTEPMNQIRFLINQVANKEANVLILGESGTGKEVIARNVHLLSGRVGGPFVPVNCGAIPAELLESELFGHEKGAFTGAISSRKGRFELAQGGTLFLDEIGDMPLQMQVKLLRVLQERTYERVGGTKAIKADVRVVAATHRNLEDMIEEGKFREDLFYRLNVFPIESPSLCQRADDLELLVQEFTHRFEREHKAKFNLTERALESLKQHQWPGNVRELGNLVERLLIMFPNQMVDVHDLPQKYRYTDDLPFIPEYPDEIMERQALIDMFADHNDPDDDGTDDFTMSGTMVADPTSMMLPTEGIDLKEFLAELEVNLIEQALQSTDYVVARAAEQLNLRRTTLVEKMRKYDLNKDD